VFALPQPDGRTLVGLTDEAYEGALPDVPEPPESDIAFLLDVVNPALEIPVGRADVVGAFAGLRPLLEAEGHTADLSRRHAVFTSADGIVTVVGGKLTTYRRMAQDAIDAVVSVRGLTAGPSRTTQLPLVGAGSPAELAAVAAPPRLVRRYGTEAAGVAAMAAGDDRLLEPLAPGIATTPVELLWGLAHEGALDVDDLLDRRTRIGLVPADRAVALPAARGVLERYSR
jgi:glycerol-3-phosphate dehydrogenase